MVVCVRRRLSLQFVSSSPAAVCAQWVSHVIVERVIDEEKGRVGASGRTLQGTTSQLETNSTLHYSTSWSVTQSQTVLPTSSMAFLSKSSGFSL